MEELEKHINALEDTVDDLKDENETLRRELSLSSPLKVGTLVASVREYLEWLDSPNQSMSKGAVTMVRTHLREVVDGALSDLP
jgi:hypothetical protein